jgi:GMP synthase (glutamine-hydrolysing)
MRQDESAGVQKALAKIGLKLNVVDAKQDFFMAKTHIDDKEVGPLSQVIDPQEKRKIIGDTFIRVTENYLKTLGLDLQNTFLVQGNLASRI